MMTGAASYPLNGSSGAGIRVAVIDGEVEVSNETNFAIFYYYRDGDWDLY